MATNTQDSLVRVATEGQIFVNDNDKVQKFLGLKKIALANARLLYGSERNKFYDIAMGSSENGNTTVMLVCSEHNSSKFLRKEVNACGISAARALVDWLLKDTGLLFEKSNINGTIRGQQGRQGDDGKFVLHVSKTNSRDLPQNTPTAPKAAGFKRQRTDHDGSGGRGQGRSQFGGESNIEPQEGLSYGEDEDRSMYMD